MRKEIFAVLVSLGSLSLCAQAPQAAPAGPPAPALPSAWEHPSGPYAVVMEEDATLPDHTFYRPSKLDKFVKSDRMPVVAFSGPGCDFNGTAFRPFFTELASHGFLVIANGPPEPRGRSGRGAPTTKAADLLASVDWVGRETARKESKYYGHLDEAHIAMMGQSCGGLQTLSLVSDPRISTVVMWDSGIFNTPMNFPNMVNLTKDELKKIHVPIAYFVGGTDMARPNAEDDFKRIEDVPVFLGVLEIPGDAHAGTFRQDNGGKFAVAGVAWLKWHFKNDKKSAQMFQGPHCGLCSDPQWKVEKKKID